MHKAKLLVQNHQISYYIAWKHRKLNYPTEFKFNLFLLLYLSISYLQCLLHIHQSPIDCLIHSIRPQRTIQMNPFINIKIQKPGWTISHTVSYLMAKYAFPRIIRHFARHHSDTNSEQKFHDLSIVWFLIFLSGVNETLKP